ncbi:hypothetical protein ACQQ2N_12290 [Dokdonella sp. MW10]|uniref:hypothetical protein n=1 Tax=Dokdonella sp. MW10 TaxID=2992926 RepID=UPI003F80CE39
MPRAVAGSRVRLGKFGDVGELIRSFKRGRITYGEARFPPPAPGRGARYVNRPITHFTVIDIEKEPAPCDRE